MGWRKREPKRVPFDGETAVVPKGDYTFLEKSPSAIFKLVCYTLFDNSPASALKLLDSAHDVPNRLTTQSPSQKSLSSPKQKQERRSNSAASEHSQMSSSKSLDYEANRRVSSSDSSSESSGRGGAKFLRVFKRKQSRLKTDVNIISHSNPYTPDGSNRDLYYNGDDSSNSLFEIEINDEGKKAISPQVTEVVTRLESEVDILRRRLEKEEEEVKKLKDELYSLRSSSGSSQLESPGSDIGLSKSLFSGSESSRRSTLSDKSNGDPQIYLEFCPSNEDQLVKLAEEELLSRSRVCPTEGSDNDSTCSTDESSVGLSSLSKEHLDEYCSEPALEHMNTFLADAAALGKEASLEFDRGDHQPLERRDNLDDRILETDAPFVEAVPSSCREENCDSNHSSASSASTVDYGVPADPEIARGRREVKARHQETEEKLRKLLRSPRRELSRSPTNGYSSNSSSGASSPNSERGSPESSFTGTLWCTDKVTEFDARNLDLELSSRRDSVVTKFTSFTRVPLLHLPARRERRISEVHSQATGAQAGAEDGEVHFQSTVSLGRSFGTRSGPTKGINSSTRGVISAAADLDHKSGFSGRNVQGHAEVSTISPPVELCNGDSGDVFLIGDRSYCIRRTSPSGRRLTRFGEEAAREAAGTTLSSSQSGFGYSPRYLNPV
ncbi:hypothetical protein R1sor_013395 [Riccia sorocarpa]|uniref:Uncharacterized protein n=1 Tax=Riccia sorocarpa TaxID=122646 RepID=A0ABD3HAI6_9MARC